MGEGERYAGGAFLFAAGCVAGWLWAIRPGVLAEIEWLQVMTAFGTVGAVFVAVGLTLYQKIAADDVRRKEPLYSLRVIIEHSTYSIKNVPDSGLPGYTEAGRRNYEDVLNSLETARAALASFPTEKLLDFSAIQSIFQMQEALLMMRSALESVDLAGSDWTTRWIHARPKIQRAKVTAELAGIQLRVALDGAGII